MDVRKIFDLLPRYRTKYPKPDVLVSKENGEWKKYNIDQFIEYVDNLSYGFMAMGLQKGDKIALLANNRAEWNFVDFAALQVGVVDVPVYPTISEHDLKFIFTDAEVKYVFVSSRELYQKVKMLGLPGIKDIYTFDKVEGVGHWTEILELGKRSKDEAKLKALKESVNPDEMATILYTSGTTGNPKGVMLSHTNLMSNVYACRELCPVDNRGRALSFLPLNHVYERMLTYHYLYRGIAIYYAESIDTISENLREIKPDAFSTVPRLLEKVYDRITAKGAELSGIKRILFFWALNLGLRYELHRANGWWYEFQLSIANKLIFNKWREALGGNVKVIVSGGAALQPRLARVFWAAGIHVLEGYGLTETSPVMAVNNLFPNSAKFGTVGPVIEDVTIKIAEDGEILCKGPNVMLGYYKNPTATAEAIDSDGWFHTGDIGIMDEGRFLKITDRKKEIFKTSGGKYIAPQMIENKLKESRFIEQGLVIGEGQKFASAFIVPAFSFLKDWCEKKGIAYTSNEEMIKNLQVIERMKQEVEEVNKNLAHYETIKKIELMPREWSIEKGEMTPKLSLKRKVILTANKELFAKIYNE